MLTNNELCSPFVLSGLALYQRAKPEIFKFKLILIIKNTTDILTYYTFKKLF